MVAARNTQTFMSVQRDEWKRRALKAEERAEEAEARIVSALRIMDTADFGNPNALKQARAKLEVYVHGQA